jgi:hypothetical protein
MGKRTEKRGKKSKMTIKQSDSEQEETRQHREDEQRAKRTGEIVQDATA